MNGTSDFLVVGGGIWGLSTAYHLAARGAGSVRLLERNPDLADETTPRAAGLVGQIRSSPTMCAAIRYALDLLDGFAAETGHDPGLRRPGSLMVALTGERMEAYRRLIDLADRTGVRASLASRGEMKRMCPEMEVERLEGGLFVEGDGYVDARRCALAYGAAARERGVEIECGVEVDGFTFENGRACGVSTGSGPRAAGRVIVTCGPWTGRIARIGGLELPMQTIRHQRARTVPVGGIPDDHPTVRVTDVSCYLRPDQGGYLFGFFEPEPHLINLDELPAGFRSSDVAEPRETIAEARRRLAPCFPVLAGLEIAEYHQGITSFAPDGRYLIGPVPGVEGLIVASGCAAVGIAGSAAVGRWLAEWAIGGEPGEELENFGLLRFGEQAGDREWVRDRSREFYAGYYSIESMEGG